MEVLSERADLANENSGWKMRCKEQNRRDIQKYHKKVHWINLRYM